MAKKLIPYMNRFNGDIKIVTKSQAKKLSEDYSAVTFVENEQGERVMRLKFTDENGNSATVDVAENGEREVTVDGIGSTK